MKHILLTLLLCPVIAQAQFLEASINAGANIHNFTVREQHFDKYDKTTPTPGYATSISATIKLPENFRVGVAISSYRIGFRYEYLGLHPGPAIRAAIKPFLFEVLAISRNYFKTFNVDFGATGGVCVNSSFRVKQIKGDGKVRNSPYKDTWITYGLLGTFQYNISETFALGGEIQPKFIHGDIGGRKSVFVLPVCVKGTIKI